MSCGGPLHRANYERKPRGVPPGTAEATAAAGEVAPDVRLSFCCGREGCRRRHTPASVRFLGRRVYVGVLIVLVMAMEQGIADFRARRLGAELGVSRRTLSRWRAWWAEVFPAGAVWQAARGRVWPPADEARLPASLLERFLGSAQDRVLAVLRLLLPLTGVVPPDTS